MTRFDEQIKKDVVDQLYWDQRVDASDVEVAVDDGEVSLSGVVPNFISRQAAENDVISIPGVLKVNNQLEVLYPTAITLPTDDEIQTHLESVIKWNSYMDESGIGISVEDGVVTLKGSVDSYWKKERLDDVARDILGVKDVVNELAVVPTKDIADQVIAETIMDALDRNIFVDAESLEVTVRNGEVTLTGNVEEWNTFRTAYEIALYTPGVTNVINNLTLRTEQ